MSTERIDEEPENKVGAPRRPKRRGDKSLTNRVADRMTALDFRYLAQWLPNPDKVLETHGKDIDFLEQVLEDPFVAACVNSLKVGVRRLEWDLNEGDKVTESRIDVVRTALKRMFTADENGGWHRLIGTLLDAQLFGYAPHEIIWRVDQENHILVPDVLEAKPPKWFTFGAENQLLFKSKENPVGVDVPPFKFVTAVHDATYENPYGRGVLSRAFWSYYFKKSLTKLLVRFSEKYGTPYLHAQHNLVQDAEIDQLRDELDALVQDGVAVTRADIVINFLTAGAQSTAIYAEAIALFREEIASAILSHTAGAVATPGKLGNDTMAMTVREDVIEAGARLCEEAINVVIRWMYEVNKWDATDPVVFRMFPPEDVDLMLAQRDQILSGLGVEFKPQYIERVYGIPSEDFELKSSAQRMQEQQEAMMKQAEANRGKGEEGEEGDNPFQKKQFGKKDDTEPDETGEGVTEEEEQEADEARKASFAERTVRDSQDLVDELAVKTASKAKPFLQALMETVTKHLDGAGSYEDAIAGLQQAYAEIPTEDVEDMFLQALVGASSVGYHMANDHATKA